MNDDTTKGSRHLSVWVDAAPAEVYAVASDPSQRARWAAGLADPALASGGEAKVEFVPRNELGVLDHVVLLPSGEEVYNPMRVVPAGPGERRCEVVFTLRRRPGVSDEEFNADAAAVIADLETLRQLVENPDEAARRRRS